MHLAGGVTFSSLAFAQAEESSPPRALTQFCNNSYSICFLFPKSGGYSFLVKTDDNFVTDCDNWHAELACFVDHFLSPHFVRGDVIFRVDDVVLCKIFLCGFAIGASWS